MAIPWLEWPIIFDVRTRPRAIKSSTGTRDLQMVDIGLRVLTRPDPIALPDIYRMLGLDYDDKVLPSIVNEVVKQVLAQYTATALLTQREQVSRTIKSMLEERARDFHIILEVNSNVTDGWQEERQDTRYSMIESQPMALHLNIVSAGRFHHGPEVQPRV